MILNCTDLTLEYSSNKLRNLQQTSSYPNDYVPPSWPVGVVKLWHKQFNHIKGNSTLCSHAQWYCNGYQLLCNAHIVVEPYRGTETLFLFYY